MALRKRIVSDFKSGRKFFNLCALFDRSAFLRKLACSERP